MLSTARRSEQQLTGNEDFPFWKCLLAEIIGTFYLTFVSAAPIIISTVSTHELQIAPQTSTKSPVPTRRLQSA